MIYIFVYQCIGAEIVTTFQKSENGRK